MRITEVTVARHMGHFFEALRMISSVQFTPGCQMTNLNFLFVQDI